MRRVILGVCVTLAVFVGMAGGATAQERDETLADIRQELSVLYVELQRLKRELSTTGGAAPLAGEGPLLDRVNAIEAELARLTDKTEELEHRIDRVVADGTNRLGDLEFRLCELEADCDIAQLDEGTTLGGVATGPIGDNAGTGAEATEPGAENGMQLAVGEQTGFEAANRALEEGDFADAAERFARFRQDYPGSPLGAQAGLKRGQALEETGAMTKAARAYLDTFSAAPDGPQAPEALYRLGRALGRLGQTEEACTTLSEVGVRFPGGRPAQDARAEMQSLGCQ